jgi:ABC-type lipoprotein release transport system permease subunit
MQEWTDIWECARREWRRRTGRFLTNLLGFLLAVGLMVVLVHVLSLSRGAEAQVMEQTGTNFIGFVPEFVATGAVAVEPRVRSGDPNEDFIVNTILSRPFPLTKVPEVKALPMVVETSPMLFFRLRDPAKSHYYTIGGFDPASVLAVGENCCAPTEVIAGTFLQSGQASAGVLIEENFAYSWRLKVGDPIDVGGSSFVVQGIINTGTRPVKADIYLLFTAAEELVNRALKTPIASAANIVLVRIDSSKNQDAAMAAVKKVLGGGILSTYSCADVALTVAGISERAIWMMNFLALLSAVLISLKAQAGHVLERSRDIGILKAIGWTSRRIVAQILVESVVSAGIGGVAGCLLGTAVFLLLPAAWVPAAELVPRTVLPEVLLLGMLVSLGGGIIAGAIPGWLAARQTPMAALRHH